MLSRATGLRTIPDGSRITESITHMQVSRKRICVCAPQCSLQRMLNRLSRLYELQAMIWARNILAYNILTALSINAPAGAAAHFHAFIRKGQTANKLCYLGKGTGALWLSEQRKLAKETYLSEHPTL